MIKATIFDNDGVAVIGGMFGQNMQDDFGFGVDELVPFFRGKFQDCLIGKADLKEELAQYISEKQLSITTEELMNYWFKEEDKPNQELLNKILELKRKGIKCFLATNQEKYRTEYLINNMNFGKYFDHIYASYLLGAKKPSLEFYKKLLENLKEFKPEEILFFDDTKENILAAKEIGIKAEVYTTFETFIQALESYNIIE